MPRIVAATCCTAAATCASINIANSDTDAADGGTGTKTTTGTVAVSCNDGFSGSGDAVCTADSGASTAAFQFAGCTGALVRSKRACVVVPVFAHSSCSCKHLTAWLLHVRCCMLHCSRNLCVDRHHQQQQGHKRRRDRHKHHDRDCGCVLRRRILWQRQRCVHGGQRGEYSGVSVCGLHRCVGAVEKSVRCACVCPQQL